MKICRRGTRDVWEISPGQVIGRLKACEIQIDDSSISRQHARIEERAEKLWIVDMGSSNGTFRNGLLGDVHHDVCVCHSSEIFKTEY